MRGPGTSAPRAQRRCAAALRGATGSYSDRLHAARDRQMLIFAMTGDICSICAGEGRTRGAWGRTMVCPACNGSGRRSVGEDLIRDVTKTKPSHYAPKEKKSGAEVRDSPACPAAAKERLIREIIEYEGSHGRCTKTFTRKVRKQLRATDSS